MTDPLDAYDSADDVLVFYHPTDAVEIDDDYLTFGPVAAGSSDDRPVRVFNASADYVAAAVTVTVTDPLTDDVVSGATQYLLSVDGDTFTATIGVGDLPPHAATAPIILRRVTPPDAEPGTAGFLLVATAGGWTPADTDRTAAVADDPVDIPADDEEGL